MQKTNKQKSSDKKGSAVAAQPGVQYNNET